MTVRRWMAAVPVFAIAVAPAVLEVCHTSPSRFLWICRCPSSSSAPASAVSSRVEG